MTTTTRRRKSRVTTTYHKSAAEKTLERNIRGVKRNGFWIGFLLGIIITQWGPEMMRSLLGF